MIYDNKFRSRKFILSMIAMLTASTALLAGLITGLEYAGCVTPILGLYGWQNLKDND